MPSGRLAFKETDIARALRAADKAGVGAFHLRIDRVTGDILILPGVGPGSHSAPPPAGSDEDLDAELERWRAQQQG